MSDMDVMYAGGSTGAMSRAAQLQAQAATNAARRAASLVRQAPPRPAPVPGRAFRDPDARENGPQYERPLLPPARVSPLLDIQPNPARPKSPTDLLGFQRPGIQGLAGLAPSPDTHDPGLADRRENKQDWTGQPYKPPGENPKDKAAGSTYKAFLHDSGRDTNLTTGAKVNNTVQKMLDDIAHDPLASFERQQAAKELAEGLRAGSRSRLFTQDELIDNPLLRTLNDLSVWSQYHNKVADWNAKKKKLGDSASTNGNQGDGTFTGLVDNGSFSSVTSPSNLPPYIVARDQHGMLTVLTADQWIQGKFSDMHKNPGYAAQMITALALTSMYGSDSTAKGQGSRVAVDKNGNPVKAIVSSEDLSALKQFANQAAIYQNQGDETPIDDVLSELVKLGRQVSDQNGANGEHGGSGYGGGGFRRYGGGGGGGFSHTPRAVQYTDTALLNAQLDSIARTRMGQSLNDQQHAEFVAYFHQLEAQNQEAYVSGQPFTQLDPQAQAVAWVESHFGKEAAANQYGDLAARFMQMMGSSTPFGGLG